MTQSHASLQVQQFRASLLWPLQTVVDGDPAEQRKSWALLEAMNESPWRRLDDEFTEDPAQFQERHYREFVSFLPYFQRFWYGDGFSGSRHRQKIDSPLHIFRRHDIASIRVTLKPGDEPVLLEVVHLDLYFFDDLDVTMMNLEVKAGAMPLILAQEILFRLGRAYPSGWDEDGEGVHNVHRAELLDAAGQVLACSDTSNRNKFLGHVCQYRNMCISSHWAWMLAPLVLADSNEPGVLRFRLIEYHRMPVMVYLAVDNPRAFSREDWVRTGLASLFHPTEPIPWEQSFAGKFEQKYCQDRYWLDTQQGPNTRFICTGNTLTVVGEAGSPVFIDAERGVLGQFRHQYFILFLVAHLHRAALLVFSEVLVQAVNSLDIQNETSVKRFKRRIRSNFETFLRFTHRYWFHEVSERPHLQAVFKLCSRHLRNDALYEELRDEIREMSHYLDSDSQRRQSNTVVRLTVITILGLIATVTTGYFGMNIIAFDEGSVSDRLLHGAVASGIFVFLVLFAVAKSKRLSDFLESLADERVSFSAKIGSLFKVFRQSGTSPTNPP